jgi:hypothetical protein
MKNLLWFLLIFAAYLLAVFAGACMGICLSGCTASLDINTATNPECQYQVYRHSENGWLLSNPELHIVFYGSQWPNNYQQELQIQEAWTTLFQNNVLQRLSEYGIKHGSVDPTYYNSALNLDIDSKGNLLGTPAVPLVIDDGIIATTINNDIQSGLLPFPNSNTNYTIMLPPNVTTQQLSGEKAVGHHRYATYDGVDFTYSVVVYQSTNDAMDVIMEHELAEASTNPDLANGYYGTDTSQEVGDLCVWQYDYISGYQVQRLWSEATCTCL